MAALGDNIVEVVDLIAGQRTLTLTGWATHMTPFVPQRNRTYVATGGNGKLTIFEGASFGPLHTIGFSGVTLTTSAAILQAYIGYGSGALGGSST